MVDKLLRARIVMGFGPFSLFRGSERRALRRGYFELSISVKIGIPWGTRGASSFHKSSEQIFTIFAGYEKSLKKSS